jgi:hypothetical protein
MQYADVSPQRFQFATGAVPINQHLQQRHFYLLAN